MSNPNNKSILPALVTIASVGVAAGAAYLARQRKDQIKGQVVARVLEAPAGRSSYTDLSQSLERGGVLLAGRALRAGDTANNREVLIHIIGIERWGQNHLKAALGQQKAKREEYQPYRPPQDTSLADLRTMFSTTRAKTIDLARQLHKNPPSDQLMIEHNGLGPLTPKAWLRYLTQHADLESRRLRAGAHKDLSNQEPVKAVTVTTEPTQASS